MTEIGTAGSATSSDLPPFHLRLLDGFELTAGGRPVVLALAPQRVTAFLALRKRPLRRAYVAGMLWFETTDCSAHACLRSALWRLQQCCRGFSPVEATRTHLRLSPLVSVDVREQDESAGRIFDRSRELDPTIDFVALLEGELLPDWYEDWVLFERDRLHQRRLHALEALANRLTEERRYGEAVEAGLAAVRGDPLRESARLVLIRTYLAEGNSSDALNEYLAYRSLLARRLGVEPSSRLDALIAEVRQVGRAATR